MALCGLEIFAKVTKEKKSELHFSQAIFTSLNICIHKNKKHGEFHENQVFQLLHETRKTLQVQNIELMYFSFNNSYDI